MEAPHDSSTAKLLTVDTREANNYREQLNARINGRGNGHSEMVHTVSGYKARFTVWSHRYSQIGQISRDMDNFISFILLKQQQNGSKPNPTKGVWRSKVTTKRNCATS
jgi:hypothetical protein